MKVLVIDDHPLILDALREICRSSRAASWSAPLRTPAKRSRSSTTSPNVRAGPAPSRAAGHGAASISWPISCLHPGVPVVVVLSATHDDATVNAALGAGARGFIAKTASPAALLEALRQVLEGIVSRAAADASAASTDGARIGATALGLTARQADVLRLLAQGKPNKLICRDLRLSEGTVKVHVSAILKALNVASRTQAVAELARRGIHVDLLRRPC